jgi:plastocyanin
MRTLVLSLAVAIALGGGVAVAQSSESPSPVPAASAAAVPSPEPSPISTIHIKNFAFVPDTVTIRAGQVVRFVQDDGAAHTVTAADKLFDSGNLDKGQSWSHAFDKAGTYAYLCAYHPTMRGTVIVK